MSFETTQNIDSQNGESILNLSLHEIQLPYPPPFITVSDFINKRESSSRIFRKSPNAFFIYRKAFTNYLTLLNYKLTMIDVSKFVSNRWKDESNEVKEAYMKIAKEIDVELKEKRKHDKKCPVIWKIDKESKKQKRKSKKNLTNNNLNNDNNDINNNNNNNNNINSNNNDKDKNSNNSLNKFRNTTTTTDITFEFQNFSILDNENDQKNLRSLERVESSQSPQSSLGNSPYPLINLSGIIPTCNFVNYDMESPSNESEEDNLDCQHPTYSLSNCDQMLDPLYCSRLNTIESPHQIHATSQGYENFVYSLHDNGIFAPQYGWEPCINGGNLTCQQVNQFQ